MRYSLSACWALVFAPQLATAWFDPRFNATENLRPNNITGLDYRIYPYIGSYYNGTVRFTLNLRNDTESPMPNEVCSDFINDKIQIEWNALLTIAKPDPKDDNPVLFTMQAWDKGFDFLGDYSAYQHSSSRSILFGKPKWFLFMPTETRSDGAYKLWGNHTIDPGLTEELAFNLTEVCPPRGQNFVSDSELDDYLFEGDMLQPYPPEWSDENPASGWATRVSMPRIDITFDDNRASGQIAGMFSISSRKTKLVGYLTAEFSGNVDSKRSDNLLLGKAKPEWTPTLGFSGKTLDSSGTRRAALGNGLLTLILVISVLFLAL
ncbi:hypothetical protein C7999DRAFT_29617 [Corynascus novoguineensis]|uniref:Uncharacterized protein n=1 Tax=Corynascus novoguineensis TaxID=1126955 RepID=A0AAN7CZH2_9PEZI|nr:hypothetical protein C7999DRAFT_29617 [Corynascus novoguineensis]